MRDKKQPRGNKLARRIYRANSTRGDFTAALEEEARKRALIKMKRAEIDRKERIKRIING